MTVPPQLASLARESSLFSTASFHEHMRKKTESTKSIVAMSQEPPESGPRPKAMYENTYQLEPKKKFQAGRVKAIIDEVLEAQLKDEKYDPKSCRQLVKTLSEIIKSKVKDCQYERYKIVCLVTIGQLKEEGLRIASRCVWDPKWDTFATSTYTRKEKDTDDVITFAFGATGAIAASGQRKRPPEEPRSGQLLKVARVVARLHQAVDQGGGVAEGDLGRLEGPHALQEVLVELPVEVGARLEVQTRLL